MKSNAEIQPAIEVKNLMMVYRRRGQESLRAVDDLSFTARPGEIFGILGPNGAGKTTTLRILMTLLRPTGGSATILGYDVVQHPLEVRKRILAVMQENAIDLYLSVFDNLRTFGRFHFMSGREIEHSADRVIELFGLREHRNQKAIDLSGGLKRRVQVAKVFMVDTPIVFLDEATTGMDTINKRKTIAAVRDESRKGRTVVLTTHILAEAEELCSSLVIINHGKAIASGSPDEVKKLSLRLFTLSMSFDTVPDQLAQFLRNVECVNIEVQDATVEMILRDETAVLPILTGANELQTVKHFEVTGASLEDVFVHLIDQHKVSS